MKFTAMGLLGASWLTMGCTDETGGEGHAVTDLTVTLSVENIFTRQFDVTLVPSSSDVTYYWNVIPKSDFDRVGDSGIFEEDQAAFASAASESGISLSQAIAQKVRRDNATQTIEQKLPDTQYVLYAYGLDSDGRHGKLAKLPFKTGFAPLNDTPPFKVAAAGQKMTEFDITVTPDNANVRYMMNYATEAEINALLPNYDNDMTQTLVRHFIDQLYYSVTLRSQQAGRTVTKEEIVQSVLRSGSWSEHRDFLEPNTKYYIYAMEVNEHGEPLSLAYTTTSTTARVMNNDFKAVFTIPTLTEKVNDADVNSAAWGRKNPGQTYSQVKIAITPADQRYMMYCVTRAEYDRMGGDTAQDRILTTMAGETARYEKNKVGSGTYAGNQGGYFGSDQPLYDNTDYVVLIAAYNQTYVSNLFKVDFKTERILSPAELDIKIAMENNDEFPASNGELGIGAIWAKTALIPNDNLVAFHHSFMTETEYNRYSTDKERVENAFNTYVNLWVDKYAGSFTRETAITNLTRYGANYYREYDFRPDTKYYQWAGSFDANGQLLSSPFIKEFRTLKWEDQLLSGTAAPTNMRYFDYSAAMNDTTEAGNALALFDAVELTNSNDLWMRVFLRGDYTNEAEYSDGWCASKIYIATTNYESIWRGEGNKRLTARQRISRLAYDSDWTFLMCTFSPSLRDGKQFGKVYRYKIHPTAADITPASQFPADVRTEANTRSGVPMPMSADLTTVQQWDSPLQGVAAIASSAPVAIPDSGYHVGLNSAPVAADQMGLITGVSFEQMQACPAVRFSHRAN